MCENEATQETIIVVQDEQQLADAGRTNGTERHAVNGS